MCMGDITVLGELLVGGVTEAAAESLCDYVAETVLEEAVEHVISLAINATKVKNNMSDFKKFAEQLGEELNRNHSRKGQEMMNEAQRVFTTFSECDTDGNGVISREEFIHFCAVYGVSRREALRLFEEADRDQNGEEPQSCSLGTVVR